MILYGIKNCDTVKKARKWLEENGVAYRFHDFRVDGLEPPQLQAFAAELGWDGMINKSSTSWRQLSPEQQTGLDEASALRLMLETPTLIKRPVLDTGNGLIQGFKAEVYQDKLK